jgi:hypothetical protein
MQGFMQLVELNVNACRSHLPSGQQSLASSHRIAETYQFRRRNDEAIVSIDVEYQRLW